MCTSEYDPQVARMLTVAQVLGRAGRGFPISSERENRETCGTLNKPAKRPGAHDGREHSDKRGRACRSYQTSGSVGGGGSSAASFATKIASSGNAHDTSPLLCSTKQVKPKRSRCRSPLFASVSADTNCGALRGSSTCTTRRHRRVEDERVVDESEVEGLVERRGSTRGGGQDDRAGQGRAGRHMGWDWAGRNVPKVGTPTDRIRPKQNSTAPLLTRLLTTTPQHHHIIAKQHVENTTHTWRLALPTRNTRLSSSRAIASFARLAAAARSASRAAPCEMSSKASVVASTIADGSAVSTADGSGSARRCWGWQQRATHTQYTPHEDMQHTQR